MCSQGPSISSHRRIEILLLRDIEDVPGSEVAAMLGLTLSAMKTRLHRARLRPAARVSPGSLLLRREAFGIGRTRAG